MPIPSGADSILESVPVVEPAPLLKLVPLFEPALMHVPPNFDICQLLNVKSGQKVTANKLILQ